jgi:hypothetical protein
MTHTSIKDKSRKLFRVLIPTRLPAFICLPAVFFTACWYIELWLLAFHLAAHACCNINFIE